LKGHEIGHIQVGLRFYGPLNALLSKKRRNTTFKRILPEPTSVKDLIEGCGVPHTEVDLVFVDGRKAAFDNLVQGGERISVYPVFLSLDISESDRMQVRTLESPSFVVDVNLGKLARYLRMAGFDSKYRNDADDKDLIKTMLEEDRVLLTRDRKLLMHKVVEKGYLVRSDQPVEQLEEVLIRFDLYEEICSFTRCIHCNGLLKEVSKNEVLDQLEPLTRRYYDRFSKCSKCGQIYWPGSHRERLNSKLQKILDIK